MGLLKLEQRCDGGNDRTNTACNKSNTLTPNDQRLHKFLLRVLRVPAWCIVLRRSSPCLCVQALVLRCCATPQWCVAFASARLYSLAAVLRDTQHTLCSRGREPDRDWPSFTAARSPRPPQAEPGTRVVFVSVRGRDAALPRTRRKRALGVSSDATLDSFHSLVCTRLALRAVKAIYHADGRVLRSMEELQDIEDLEVEVRGCWCSPAAALPCRAHAGCPQEVEDPGGEAKGHGAPYSSPPSVQTSRKAGQGGLSIAVDAEGDGDEDKYARRGARRKRLPSVLLRHGAARGARCVS